METPVHRISDRYEITSNARRPPARYVRKAATTAACDRSRAESSATKGPVSSRTRRMASQAIEHSPSSAGISDVGASIRSDEIRDEIVRSRTVDGARLLKICDEGCAHDVRALQAGLHGAPIDFVGERTGQTNGELGIHAVHCSALGVVGHRQGSQVRRRPARSRGGSAQRHGRHRAAQCVFRVRPASRGPVVHESLSRELSRFSATAHVLLFVPP